MPACGAARNAALFAFSHVLYLCVVVHIRAHVQRSYITLLSPC
ncbi:hypothetical protein HMPREF9248_0293 [Fannyhessea vaginae PB189-T1-4]|uniref:Uncharacterized protein n=1 Tax=Fannyhessea vaginae PB189-T1-4 TaxID=866774 RepID=A0ABN0B067_9ACTN|nr:hypothetical protein HMPREF9248_0293 [Fannyhessea vaginae PB189-T1-4]